MVETLEYLMKINTMQFLLKNFGILDFSYQGYEIKMTQDGFPEIQENS